MDKAQIRTIDEEQRVWQHLSSIDVGDHVEKKGGLSYLSWACAWGIFVESMHELNMRFDIEWHGQGDPGTGFGYTDITYYPDGSASVECTISLCGPSGTCLSRSESLPVMDHRNKAIKNPDSFQINTAKKRCQTKCMSLFGLAHYLYVGEDTPPNNDSSTVKQVDAAKNDLEQWIFAAKDDGSVTANTIERAAKLLDGNDLDKIIEASKWLQGELGND